MAAGIKMPLGMEVGLSPGDFVLDGDPASPSPKGGRAPQIFGPCLLWPNGWMMKMAVSIEARLSLGDFMLDGDPGPLPKKGAEPPDFRPIFIVTERLDGSRWHLAWR